MDRIVLDDAYQKAVSRGYDEALLVNAKGHVCEASRANLFVLRAGILLTPPLNCGCLNGITRARVIKQAARQGIAVREKNLAIKDILNSDGAFVTNALIGLMPLASIDGRVLKFSDIRLALLK